MAIKNVMDDIIVVIMMLFIENILYLTCSYKSVDETTVEGKDNSVPEILFLLLTQQSTKVHEIACEENLL